MYGMMIKDRQPLVLVSSFEGTVRIIQQPPTVFRMSGRREEMAESVSNSENLWGSGVLKMVEDRGTEQNIGSKPCAKAAHGRLCPRRKCSRMEPHMTESQQAGWTTEALLVALKLRLRKTCCRLFHLFSQRCVMGFTRGGVKPLNASWQDAVT